MAPLALTRKQVAALDELVATRRLSPLPPDESRAASFLAVAVERIGQLEFLTSDSVKLDVAYDAAHDIGEAMLAAYGFRTVNAPGQHRVIGQSLCAVIDGPPGASAAQRFDRLRRIRNSSHHEAGPVSSAESKFAERIAHQLHDAAVARGLGPESCSWCLVSAPL